MRIIQINLESDYSEAIAEAINVLKWGGVIVYPTDTVYGLGANGLEDLAVRKVFRIKDRPLSKPLPLMVKNMTWAKELSYINDKREEFLNSVWPGKTTVVLPKKSVIPDVVTNAQSTVGLRIPDFQFIDRLLGKYGYPITGTSANVSGLDHSNRAEDIIAMFENRPFKPDLIIDAGTLPKSDPSAIIDLTGSEPKVLRVGMSSPDQLKKLLGF